MLKPAVIVFTALVLPVVFASASFAQSASAVIGTWETYDAEKEELVRLDLGEDGVVNIEVVNIDYGFLLLDEENHRMAIYQDEEDLEDPDRMDWVDYRVQGNKLTIMAEPEENVVLNRIDRPEKANNALIGSWMLDIEESTMEFDETESQMVITFYNDGRASYQELDEVMTGTFFVDAEMGAITFTLDDDVEEGTYKLAGRQAVACSRRENLRVRARGVASTTEYNPRRPCPWSARPSGRRRTSRR